MTFPFMHGWMFTVVLLSFNAIEPTNAFAPVDRGHGHCKKLCSPVQSTPFETEVFYSDEDENPYDESLGDSLRVPPDTKLVVGLNKYSHDVTICAANAETGKVLFGLSKERLTRKKHDGGNVAGLVEQCLQSLELELDAIETVVVNNHHHRVLRMEKDEDHMEWETGLGINGGTEDGYTDEENLLFNARRMEMSHHLAHAYSCAAQSTFSSGLIVVMDGMGETYRSMLSSLDDESYTSDLSFGENSYQCIPSNLRERSQASDFDWREAESVYVFEKSKKDISLQPVFKRFIEEKTPPVLYNHGFENMDSVGALYSRVSSHIFGGWNACGKVMGLAPWMGHSWNFKRLATEPLEHKIMWGKLYSDDDGKTFRIDRSKYLKGMPFIARLDPDLFDAEGNMIRQRRYDFDDDDYEAPTTMDEAEDNKEKDFKEISPNDAKRLPTKVALDSIALANRVQMDLEEVCMDFVMHFKEQTGQVNLCLAGGVALNSVLNGRITRELGFERVFIPPYPGDDGIAVGCCAFGLYGNRVLKKPSLAPLWNDPLSPYLGPIYSDAEIKRVLNEADPWLEVETIRKDDKKIDEVVKELESGGVVAWYHGRSELGPRALGHRSILADPRTKGLVRFINQYVKKRESFRPFAPSVLAERVDEWFELSEESMENVSPYMSLTASVKKGKRAQIPAVTHVDGSSRLQTVTEESNPLYHKLISAFFLLTGVPMVLNTSFNTLPGEPIVETPKDAIRSFLCSESSIEMLVMGDYIIRKKEADIRKLMGETSTDGSKLLKEPSFPKRTGPASFESIFELSGFKGNRNKDSEENNDERNRAKTRVCMPSRPMHDDKEPWFELLDDLEGELLSVCDGTVGVNEFMAEYVNFADGADTKELTEEETKAKLASRDNLLSNILGRLVRLYDHTLIYW